MRITTERCLEMMRTGLSEVLLPEVRTDDGRAAGRVILRTIDELLMRERAAAGPVSADIDAAVGRCARLLEQARSAGRAAAPHRARLERLVRMVQDWHAAPTFVTVHREILALSEELVRLVVGDEHTAASRGAMQVAQEVADLENALDQAVLSAVQPPVAPPAAQPMLGPAELAALLRDRLGESEVAIRGFERIPGGMSKRSYRFTAAAPRWGEHQLIARETAGVPHADFDCWFLSSEFQLVRDLSALRFPVPEPLHLSDDGRYYIMHRMPGRNAGMWATNVEVPKQALIEMARFLGRMHAITPDQLPLFIRASGNELVLGETMEQCVRRMLLRWRDYSTRMRRLPSPIEPGTFAWLLANVPKNDARPSLLHGDFGPHNCLWEGEQLSAVLDWEGAHFGDPAFDLGYARPQFESRMDWNEFLGHYEAAGGPHITPARLEYFERFSMYRTLLTDNQCVARGQYREKSDLFVLQVDYEYWPNFIRQTAGSKLAGSDMT